MSKTFIIAATAMSASAMAAPRIELDLSAINVKVSKTDLAAMPIYDNVIATHTTGVATHGETTPTYHATTGEVTGSKAVASRQDWTEQCDAYSATADNCPFPEARAYDHNDETVSVDTNVYLIDYDGEATAPSGDALPLAIQASDVFGTYKGKRATYLFKYDATDAAGNRAEQVVFALILNDLKAPSISSCYNEKKVEVEAAAQRLTADNAATQDFTFFCDTKVAKSFPPSSGSDVRPVNTASGVDAVVPAANAGGYTATDLVDGLVSTAIKFKLYSVSATHSGATSASDTATHSGLTQAEAKAQMITKLSAAQAPEGARWIVEAYVSDSAGYYGSSGADNKASDFLDVTVKDSSAPKINLAGQSTVYGECCRADSTDKCASQTHSGFKEVVPGAFDANDGDISADVVSTGKFTPASQPGQEYTSDAIACTGANCFTVDLTAAGVTKNIYHRVKDAAGNEGLSDANTPYALRQVEIVDRNPPTIALVGSDTVNLKSTRANGANSANYVAGEDKGVTKEDTCSSASALELTVAWEGGDPDDLSKLGTYTRAYTVCDRANADDATCDGVADWTPSSVCCADANNKAIKCCATVKRTFEVLDDEAPEISVMGDKTLVIDASTVQEYTDAGATCNDYVDGVLSHAVEVSGEVVNMRRPGTYTIRYDCVDLSGKEALPEFRTVKVKDRTCPVIVLNGAKTNYVEAGFPYVDAGFVATDDLDGVISNIGNFAQDKAGCKTDGNTINTSQAFYDRRSCSQIKDNCGDLDCSTGEYYISAFNKKDNQYNRVLVWCDMDTLNDTSAGKSRAKTYYPVTEAETDAVPGDVSSENDCHNLGMDMAVFADNAQGERLKEAAIDKFCTSRDSCVFFPIGEVTAQGQYLCSTNDEGTNPGASSGGYAHKKMGHSAEVGTYEITFKCKDRAGNKDCQWKAGTPETRTVYVKDTLPPVITLHLRNKLIARGKGDQTGLNGKSNPAGSAIGNPNIADHESKDSQLMAEETTTSANGWVMGAVASAVSGLALLGYSLRRNTQTVVSVPV
jgi:hypothetical protein